MKENRYNLRLSKEENDLLHKIISKKDITVADYIKQRLFHNNPDISDDKFRYECPTKDRHHYLTIGILQDIYMLILNQIAENKTDEEFLEIKSACRENAKQNVINYGYLKVKNE